MQQAAEVGACRDDAEVERAAAGTMPRRTMSSVKEVIVSSWAIFGSLTNVPLPCRRTSMPSRTRSSSAARTVRRETPRSAHSWRSEGIASPTSSCSIRSRTLFARLALLRPGAAGAARCRLVRSHRRPSDQYQLCRNRCGVGVTGASQQERRAGLRVEEMEAGGVDCERRRDRRRARACAGRARAVKSCALAGDQARVVVLARGRLGGDAGSVDAEERVRRRPRAPRPPRRRRSPAAAPAAASAASSNASGRMPSTTRRDVCRPGAGAGSSGDAEAAERDGVVLDRRLDEVHRGRADEGRHEEVRAARRRAPAARPPAPSCRRAAPRPACRASSPRSGRA